MEFTTWSEQLSLLEERGLSFSDLKDKTILREYLQKYNYVNVIERQKSYYLDKTHSHSSFHTNQDQRINAAATKIGSIKINTKFQQTETPLFCNSLNHNIKKKNVLYLELPSIEKVFKYTYTPNIQENEIDLNRKEIIETIIDGIKMSDTSLFSNSELGNMRKTIQTSGFLMVNIYEDDFYNADLSAKDIYKTYQFDLILKRVFLSNILLIEKQFQSQIAYFFSYCNTTPYLTVTNLNVKEKMDRLVASKIDVHSERFALKMADHINDCNKMLNKLSNLETEPRYIKAYRKYNENVPIWISINNISFGKLTHLYQFLDQKIQTKIFKSMGLDSIKELKSFMHVLVYYRNIMAHGDLFFNDVMRRTKINPVYYHGHHSRYLPQLTSPYHPRPFDVYLILKILLDAYHFSKVDKLFKQSIAYLKENVTKSHFMNVIHTMGIPITYIRDSIQLKDPSETI